MKTRTEIENEAKQILIEHSLYSIPVDPVVLAKTLGFKVNNAVFADNSIAGMTAIRNDNVMLLVNQNDSPFRKRFTIAHELAHHFLHLYRRDSDLVHKRVDTFRIPVPPEGDISYSDERIIEIEANRFAAALLMPEELVIKQWSTTPSIDEMALIFNVSSEAMGYRIAELDLE